ncbi:peptide/nickel transport system substrate-binding protein [Nonomuraea solani]|uniref:Peptide/nickel transport system substrate-binding protein n=1 Tax=Nonomuraea solani TaxID=1144553 RepID=A0A1H6EWL3_9ACTN|nr:ABC transporter substrate-binding protein [Nonomuraea solani]SEH02172.1 peptide/nickel transport system substrate-binding protein [Nonomuraea solani]
MRNKTGAVVLALTLLGSTACQSAVEQADRAAAKSASCTPGGTLTGALASPSDTSAALTGRPGNVFWVRNIVEPLWYLTNDSPDPKPLLAKSWTFEDDDKTLVLTLNQGVKFHTGRAFTADDVVYTFSEVTKAGSPSNFGPIVSTWKITATAPDTVTITSPTALTQSAQTILDGTPIVDRDTYADMASGKKLVGTGPFTLDVYRPGASMTLKKNPDYWQPGLPKLDRVEIPVIADSTAQIAALQSGRVHLASGLTVQDAMTTADGKKFTLEKSGGIFYLFGMDTSKAPLDKKEVRQAIAYAIDRERINQQVFGGLGKTGELMWPESAPGYPKELANHYAYDPAKAKELIASAGAEGATVDLTYLQHPILAAMYSVIANNLQAAGLKVTGEALAIGDYQKRVATAGFTMAYLNNAANVGQSAQVLLSVLPQIRLKNNSLSYDDPEFAKLSKAVTTATKDTGPDALKKLTEYMVDQANVQLVVAAPVTTVQAANVSGVIRTAMGSMFQSACLTAK